MIRLISALILSIIFLIFVLQNLVKVNLNFLFWSFEGSLALILILTFIVGVIVSLLGSIPFSFKKWNDNRKAEKSPESTA